MSSQEIDVTITPEQAARGVILNVDLAAGPARLRIPSGTRDGEVVPIRVGAGEVLARVTVSGSQAPPPTPSPQSAPPSGGNPYAARPARGGGGNPFATRPMAAQPGGGNPFATQPMAAQPGGGNPSVPPQVPARQGGGGKPAVGCLVVGGLLAVGLVAVFAIGSGGDSDGKASGSSTPTSSAEPSYSSSYSPSYSPSYSSSPAPASPTYEATTAPEPEPTTEAAPSPFDRGTCLSGTLPDSTTAQRVDDDVKEISCSSSEAHYRVIGSIPMTSDMDRCDDYPKTEYAFSHRYTINGAVINEYVYCLVGIGSYARS